MTKSKLKQFCYEFMFIVFEVRVFAARIVHWYVSAYYEHSLRTYAQ